MLKLAIMGLVATAGAFQGSAKPDRVSAPKRAAETEPEEPKLPPFPKDAAKWLIRGTVRASDELEPRSIETRRTPLFPARVPDEGRICDPDERRLANVFVYVERLERSWTFAVPKEPVVLEQVDGCFVPHVLGIVAGQKLDVVNRHAMHASLFFEGEHNDVATAMQPAGRPGSRAKVTLRVPEHGRLASLFQDWMECEVHVMPHPVFAVTDTEGRFELPRLPSGQYEIVATHEVLGTARKKIAIADKRPKPVHFVLRVLPERGREDERAAATRRAKRLAEFTKRARTLMESLKKAQKKEEDERDKRKKKEERDREKKD